MVTIFMTIIDYLELRFKDKIHEILTGKPANQYVLSSLLGAVPGCMDAFLVVSLYMHGLVGFGALAAVMLSTAGDEAFVMLTMVPDAALRIFVITVLLGIIGGLLADKIAEYFNIKAKERGYKLGKEQMRVSFLKEHVYGHIIKKHIPRLFLWIFITLTLIEFLIKNFDFASIVQGLPVSVLIIFAALIGIIPESGPHMIFLVLYSKGLIPFSVLLVSTLSQDGHGLLPLLSHSLKDTVYVQLFTTSFSIMVGIILVLIVKKTGVLSSSMPL